MGGCRLSVVKCVETGVLLLGLGFMTEFLHSYILFLNSLHVSPTYTILHFEHVIKYMMLLISHVILFGRLMHW